MRKHQTPFPTLGAGAAALAVLFSTATAAAAQTPPSGKSRSQCFLITQLQGWKAPDARTIYIRVNFNDFFRLDLASECSELQSPDPHLVTKTVGPAEVCSAIDWDLRVADGFGPGSFAVPCIVKSMTHLTAVEVAAIPKAFRP